MNTYLVEYKSILPGNMIREVIATIIGHSEVDAQKNVEEMERLLSKKVEVQFIETIKV